MKVMVSGHRVEKLAAYDTELIRILLESEIVELKNQFGYLIGLSGMASGVDLWFCQACLNQEIPYVAYIPFEEQASYMTEEDARSREYYLKNANEIRKQRNRHMVEDCDTAIVVWDGNKGGTHNVFQQLLEAQKSFKWINPINGKVIYV